MQALDDLRHCPLPVAGCPLPVRLLSVASLSEKASQRDSHSVFAGSFCAAVGACAPGASTNSTSGAGAVATGSDPGAAGVFASAGGGDG